MTGKDFLDQIGVPDRTIQGRKPNGQMHQYRAHLSEMLEEYAKKAIKNVKQ